MSGETRPPLSSPPILLATWFGCGYLPKFPGTWGSLGALPVAWLIHQYWGWAVLLAAAAVCFLIGIWCANAYMAASGTHDPGPVVIDEVAGQWLTLAAVPLDPLFFAAGFVLFRIADILKPWPVSWADRSVGGGLGVMLDDVLAAGYAGGILIAAQLWIGG